MPRFTRLFLLPFLLLASLSVHPPTAQAMTVLAVDFKTLVQASELVLHGKIVAIESRDRRAEGRGVWTEFTMEIADVWKGAEVLKPATKRFTWAHPGGLRTDGLMVAVPGMPTFTLGEEVVVGLEKTSQGHVVVGGPQGKWTVKTDAQGKKTVVREMPDVQFLARDAQTGNVKTAPAPLLPTRTLAEFQADVLAALKAPPTTALPVPVHRVK